MISQAGAAAGIGEFFFTKATNGRVLVDSPVFVLFKKKLAIQRPQQRCARLAPLSRVHVCCHPALTSDAGGKFLVLVLP